MKNKKHASIKQPKTRKKAVRPGAVAAADKPAHADVVAIR
jgi:hypothetical protein